jgi:hypothetical protein
LNILISPSNLRRLIFFDARGSETSLKDKSVNAKNATLSLAASSLDPAIKGRAKILNFNASGDHFEFADSDDLSFGNGAGTDTSFSLITCIKPNQTTNSIIGKYSQNATAREYELYWSTNNVKFTIRNPAGTTQLTRHYNTSLATDTGNFHTYITTYDASKAITGLKIYRDGTRIDDTTTTDGVYAGMSNATAKLGNFENGLSADYSFVGSYMSAFVAVVSEELSQSQITHIDNLLRRFVGVI